MFQLVLPLFQEPKKLKSGTVKFAVYHLCLDNVGQVIRGDKIERIDSEHPMSGTRMLRYLKQEGWIDYEVIDRSGSKYRIISVRGME